MTCRDFTNEAAQRYIWGQRKQLLELAQFNWWLRSECCRVYRSNRGRACREMTKVRTICQPECPGEPISG